MNTLAGNHFYSVQTHEDATLKISAVRVYVDRLAATQAVVNAQRKRVGDTHLVVRAQASVDQLRASLEDALAIYKAAVDAYIAHTDSNLGTVQLAASPGYNQEDWYLAMYVDMARLTPLLTKIDAATLKAESDMSDAVLPAGSTRLPQREVINWNQLDPNTLRDRFNALIKGATEAAGTVVSYAMVAGVLIVAGLFFYARRNAHG